MQKLIKLSDTHYIVVDDSEIKEGDWYYWEVTKTIQIAKLDSLNRLPKNSDGSKKITHSTQPLEEGTTIHGIEHKRWVYIKYIDLSEVKELIGEVDVAFERYPIIENDKEHNDRNYYRRSAYYQALEDNKEKKYTEADLRKAIDMARDIKDNSAHDVFTVEDISGCTEVCTYGWRNRYEDEEIIQSLQPKTEWEVEFDEQGKLRLL